MHALVLLPYFGALWTVGMPGMSNNTSVKCLSQMQALLVVFGIRQLYMTSRASSLVWNLMQHKKQFPHNARTFGCFGGLTVAYD